jgi:hypothetical protein
VGLQGWQTVWLLCQYQSSFRRVALLRCIFVEEFAVPDLFLRLPVHYEALLYRPPEGHLAEISAFLQFGADIRFPVAISGEAIGDDTRGVIGLAAGHKSGLDCIGAIVEHQCG